MIGTISQKQLVRASLRNRSSKYFGPLPPSRVVTAPFNGWILVSILPFFMTFLRSFYPSQRVKKLTRHEFPLSVLLVCCLFEVETNDDLVERLHLSGRFRKRLYAYNDPVLGKMHRTPPGKPFPRSSLEELSHETVTIGSHKITNTLQYQSNIP